jgi:hypothetical protein
MKTLLEVVTEVENSAVPAPSQVLHYALPPPVAARSLCGRSGTATVLSSSLGSVATGYRKSRSLEIGVGTNTSSLATLGQSIVSSISSSVPCQSLHVQYAPGVPHSTAHRHNPPCVPCICRQ